MVKLTICPVCCSLLDLEEKDIMSCLVSGLTCVCACNTISGDILCVARSLAKLVFVLLKAILE